MLTKERILAFLRDNRQDLQERFSVRRIGVFGSFALGKAHAASDIDILVELEEPTFDHYMDLKFLLEEHFRRPVDLVLADTVKPMLKPVIFREVTYA